MESVPLEGDLITSQHPGRTNYDKPSDPVPSPTNWEDNDGPGRTDMPSDPIYSPTNLEETDGEPDRSDIPPFEIEINATPPSPQSTPSETFHNPLSALTLESTLSDLSSTTPPPSKPVTELATIYSVIMFLISMVAPLLAVHAALFNDESVYRWKKYDEFWSWTFEPLSFGAMGISFLLKPRREDKKYKVFLSTQYVIYGFAIPIIRWNFLDDKSLAGICLRIVIWVVLLMFGLRVRSEVASLPDERLSTFLTQDLFKEGLLVGVAQLAFLSFSSVQCEATTMAGNWKPMLCNSTYNPSCQSVELVEEIDPALNFCTHTINGTAAERDFCGYKQCTRTLFSQVGLGAIITAYTMIKIISKIAPKHIVDRHIVNFRKAAAMDLNLEEAVQCFGLLNSAWCAMFLLGNYGTMGDFHDTREEAIQISILSFGLGLLLITAIWKCFVIKSEIRAEAANSNSGEDCGDAHIDTDEHILPESSPPLTEMSSFWFLCGVTVSTCQTVFNVAATLTDDLNDDALSILTMPFSLMFFIGAFFCQPRKVSPSYMWKLKAHFACYAYVSMTAWCIWDVQGKGKLGIFSLAIHLPLAAFFTLLFHWALKLRATIARLPDKDLEPFLVETMFKGLLRTTISQLFFSFRATKCVFEIGNFEECANAISSATYISLYIFIFWLGELVHNSVKSEWRKELNISIEQIARMKNLGLFRGVQGIFTLTFTGCGIFLFSTMDSEHNDYVTIWVVGLIGVGASISTLLIETYMTLKAQRMKFRSMNSSMGEEGGSKKGEKEEKTEELVEECSWIFVGASVLLTSTDCALSIMSAITLEDRYLLLSRVILAIAGISFVLSLFMKPKRTDKRYKTFLVFHFISFIGANEICVAIGDYRKGILVGWVLALARLFLWTLLFNQGLKMRAVAARLPPKELSQFLCQTVLVKGSSAIAPIIFFSFEAIACFISQDSLDNGKCKNTSAAAMGLSFFLVFFTISSTVKMAVPRGVRKSLAVDYADIATMRITTTQKLQFALTAITAASGLYLFSFLGVEAREFQRVVFVSAIGTISVGIACVISVVGLSRAHSNYLRSPKIMIMQGMKSKRDISSGDFSQEIGVSSFV